MFNFLSFALLAVHHHKLNYITYEEIEDASIFTRSQLNKEYDNQYVSNHVHSFSMLMLNESELY